MIPYITLRPNAASQENPKRTKLNSIHRFIMPDLYTVYYFIKSYADYCSAELGTLNASDFHIF